MSEGKIILAPGETLAYDRNADGYILIDGVESACTRQCGHCSKHVITVTGSGILRGYCTKCNKWLCGAPACISQCYPFEKKMEDFEKGRLICI